MSVALITQLEEKIAKQNQNTWHRGTVGIALHNLTTNEKLMINNRPFSAASTIKVLIMMAIYKKVERVELRLNTTITFKEHYCVPDSPKLSTMKNGHKISIKKLVEYMITESDNTATNILIEKIGMDYINTVIEEMGLTDTILQRKMTDVEAMKAGRDNWTTPGEMVDVLRKLVTSQLANKKHTSDMIKILCAQKDREKIPALIPTDVVVGNKPGELEGVRNDVGIIFAPFGTYILSIFCDHLLCTDGIDEWMAEISLLIYNYFNTYKQHISFRNVQKQLIGKN